MGVTSKDGSDGSEGSEGKEGGSDRMVSKMYQEIHQEIIREPSFYPSIDVTLAESKTRSNPLSVFSI